MAASPTTAVMKETTPFYVYRLEGQAPTGLPSSGYYAVTLVNVASRGNGQLYFSPASGSPLVPAGDRPLSGFTCLFHTSLLTERMRDQWQALPLFSEGSSPVYYLDPSLAGHVSRLFEQMLDTVKESYVFKYHLLGNYLTELIHQVLKVQGKVDKPA